MYVCVYVYACVCVYVYVYVCVYLSLWEGCPELRGDVKVAWVFHSERVIGERGPDWNKATGPMTATIATLHDYGWKARCPDVWTGPGGCSRTINSGSGFKDVEDMVAGSVADHLWKVASLFWCGGGLAEGLDTSAALGYHRHLVSAGHSPGRLAMLEAFLSGGYWPEERCHDAGLLDSPGCKRCGHHKSDALHILWACPRNSDIDELEVRSSQVLASDAEAGAADVPCLWLGRLVPRSLTVVTSPCPGKREITYLGGVPG